MNRHSDDLSPALLRLHQALSDTERLPYEGARPFGRRYDDPLQRVSAVGLAQGQAKALLAAVTTNGGREDHEH